jgi:hypothetical protein
MKTLPASKLRVPGTMIGFGLLFLMFISTASASASGFGPGDLLVALTNGDIQVRSATDGTYKNTIAGAFPAPAKGMALDSSGNLLVAYFWTGDHAGGNTVVKFAPDGSVIGTFGSGYNCQPSGINVDAHGNVYVGESECNGNLLKFDSSGTLTTTFAPTFDVGGVRWIDLAADGCTMYYTSSGLNVSRFNVCTTPPTQLPNFPLPLESGAAALGLRVLPDGGIILAAAYDIRHLDASGNPVGIPINIVNDNGLVGIWLDNNATTFWVSSFETGTVYKFDIASQTNLLEFSTGVNGVGAKGVLVVPGNTPTSLPGRMTGGGTFAAADGTIVSHGFELRCNAQDPRQNLEVNWGKGEKFHLDTVTTVTCLDDPAINPTPPPAPFDTMILTGTGKYDGQSGATISLVFTDAGEPGTNDSVQMVIKDSGGNTILSVPATKLLGGNQQAHRETGN